MNEIRALIVASLSTFVLAGCGGGSGGSVPSSSSAATTTTPTSVSGIAAKGLVKQGKVLVCRITNGAPEADAACASGTTGSDGAYNVTLSDGFTGPVMVKIIPGTGSMMTDETTGNDVSYNMTMRAVVPAVSAATTAHVTPFSEMAASAASTATMNATEISQSNAAVQNLMTTLGIDLSVTPIVDLKNDGTNSTRLGMEANMVKQLSRIAMAAKTSSAFKDANGVACNAAGTTTSQQFACAVTAMASVMNSYTTADPTKMATMIATLSGQNVSSVEMPIRKADGTITMSMTDMNSQSSMQTAMQNAGMVTTTAANTTNVMMGGMH